MAERQKSAGLPRMADVAREAGVATSTVSRALAAPGRVNSETRDRIVAAAERLGYTLNAAARNLRTRSSRAIMIVLPGARYHIGASQVVPAVPVPPSVLNSRSKRAPPSQVLAPVARLSMPAPGEIVPPALTVTAPVIVPVPPNLPTNGVWRTARCSSRRRG